MEISIQPSYQITINMTETEISNLINDIDYVYTNIPSPYIIDINNLLAFKNALVIAKANV